MKKLTYKRGCIAGLYSKNGSWIFKLRCFWRHCNILFDMHLFVKIDYVLFIEFFSYIKKLGKTSAKKYVKSGHFWWEKIKFSLPGFFPVHGWPKISIPGRLEFFKVILTVPWALQYIFVCNEANDFFKIHLTNKKTTSF